MHSRYMANLLHVNFGGIQSCHWFTKASINQGYITQILKGIGWEFNNLQQVEVLWIWSGKTLFGKVMDNGQ